MLVKQSKAYLVWREISKMNTLRNFAKSVFAHTFAKLEYFAKVTIYSKSPGHVL